MTESKSQRILLFSDTHIGFDHPNADKPGKNRRRGFDFFENFKIVIDKAIQLQVDYVIHCGDVFEKPTVPAFLVDQTYEQFLRIANAGIPLVIVPGNHERSVLPPSLFLNHPNIHVFTAASTFDFPGLSISGFPYFKGNIRGQFPSIRQTLENELRSENFNILCVHHAIDGVKAGYQFFEFKNRPDTLNINDLPGDFDLILSGHIHKYQILGVADKRGKEVPIIYSGSTERTMFDEIDEVKGYHLLEINGKSFDHKFIPLSTRDMHRIDLREEELSTEQLSQFLAKKISAFQQDAIVQIQAEDEQILYELSKLKTRGFFVDTMNVTISGFSALHRRKGA